MRLPILAALLIAPPVFAGPGTTSADFLRIPTSPRATAMGEAGTALSDDVLSAVSLNPAGLGRLTYAEGAFVYNQYYQDLNMQHAAFAFPTQSRGTFAASGSVLRGNSFQGFDNSGAQTGLVSAGNFSASAAYALKLVGPADDRRLGLFGGFSGTYERSNLDTVSANGALADAGVLYAGRGGGGVWSAGASVRSLGSVGSFDNVKQPSPTVYRFGLGYTIPVLGDPLTLVYDFRRPSDSAFTQGTGFEYSVKHILFWRLGYVSNQSLGSGFRAGVGLKIKVFTIDYAISEMGSFGVTHLVGISSRFGEPVESVPALTETESEAQGHVRRGRSMLQAGRAYDAALEFSEALRVDPHNEEALKLLRQVRDSMDRSK